MFGAFATPLDTAATSDVCDAFDLFDTVDRSDVFNRPDVFDRSDVFDLFDSIFDEFFDCLAITFSSFGNLFDSFLHSGPVFK